MKQTVLRLSVKNRTACLFLYIFYLMLKMYQMLCHLLSSYISLSYLVKSLISFFRIYLIISCLIASYYILSYLTPSNLIIILSSCLIFLSHLSLSNLGLSYLIYLILNLISSYLSYLWSSYLSSNLIISLSYLILN